MLSVVVHIAVAVIAGWLAVEAAYYARKHPNRDRRYPGRLRLMKILPITGWVFVVLAFFVFILWALTTQPDTLTALLVTPIWFAVLVVAWLFVRRSPHHLERHAAHIAHLRSDDEA